MPDLFSPEAGRLDLNEFSALPQSHNLLHYWPDWLSSVRAGELFECLSRQVAWEQSKVRINGQWVPIPRLNAWYADQGCDYTYSGARFQPLAWPAELSEIKSELEQALNQPFNACLINLYRDGQDSVGWHCDDEPELGAAPAIASISLGQVRDFQLRPCAVDSKLSPYNVPLMSGALFYMAPGAQLRWQHQVPKTRKVVGARISLTFRYVIPR